MAIFTAIGTAIAGALFAGSALAATVISGGLAFAAKLGLSYLTRPKKRSYTAVQGEAQFGGDVPVATLFGTGKVRGQRLYYAKFGKGNKFNVDVWALANGWCDGLDPEIYFYGKKYVLEALPTIGGETARYTVPTFGNNLTFRFYDGRPGQPVDQKLVNDTALLGTPWRPTSVAAGLCYVVVEREWSETLFGNGQPEFEFILRGLRLYDPRQDSTIAGGAGGHRLANPATWQFSQSPALQRLNYQLGLPGLISDRTLIGEGKSIGQLDLGTYFAAMNVCDTIRNGKPTYQCALYVTSDDDHTEILKEFDDAMAGYGLNRRGLSGVIAGAPQVPVAAITPADIPADRSQELQRRRSAFDLYNHLSGQFTSRENQWNAASLNPVYVNADVAADGRPRQTSNDFLQVTDPDIAQYLLNIRYRQNRKGGSATVPVSRRLGLRVQEGEWVTFDDRTWMIQEWRCSEAFEVTLTLVETGADIYSEAGITPGPIVVPSTPPINPSLLSTIQNFAVEVGLIEGSEGYQIPALRFTWTPPEDPTITAVRFEYLADATPGAGAVTFSDMMTSPEAGEYITTKNVVSGRYYTARATITTVPDRFKTWTQWLTTATATGPFTLYMPGLIDEITEQLEGLNEFATSGTREAIERLRQLALDEENEAAANYTDRQVIRKETALQVGAARAYVSETLLLAIGPNGVITARLNEMEAGFDDGISGISQLVQTEVSRIDGELTATADLIDTLSATVGEVSASVNIRAQAVASGQAGVSRFIVQVQAGAPGNFVSSALFLEADSNGIGTAGFLTDRFYIANPAQPEQKIQPFVFQGNEAVMMAARINVIRAGRLEDLTGTKFRLTCDTGTMEWWD